MTNPFDDPDALYRVLRNAEGQYSLWPSFAEVPPGWDMVLADRPRPECVAYVEEHWTDLRPAGLVASGRPDQGTGG
jgi:MbtH protein